MRISRYLLAAVLLLAVSVQASAGDFRTRAMDLLNRFNKPKEGLDTTVFYQMQPRWNVYVTGTGRQAGVEQVNHFKIRTSVTGENGTATAKTVPALLSYGLNENLYTGTGIGLGYGALSAGFSVEVGRKSARKNRVLSFSYLQDRFGADIQYAHFLQPLTYDLVLGEEGEPEYSRQQAVTANPGGMKVIMVDLFYALNPDTFSYQAVYKVNRIQRRTSGSWMLGAKYLQGETRLDPEDQLAGWLGGLSRHTTGQASLGAGYSVNFVFFHRQPSGDERMLRNLSANLTMLPMITYYNHLVSFETVFDGSGRPDGYNRLSETHGSARLNYMSRFGICYIHGRFYVNLIGDYDSFAMKGNSTVERDPGRYSEIRTEAFFHKWTATLCLNYKF